MASIPTNAFKRQATKATADARRDMSSYSFDVSLDLPTRISKILPALFQHLPIGDSLIPQSDLMFPRAPKVIHEGIAKDLSSHTPFPRHLRSSLFQ